MDSKSAREAVANARRNRDGTVTIHPVEGGGHVYPYPAQTQHVTPSEAIELLQYDPPAFELDHHTREKSAKPKAKGSKPASRPPAPLPEAPPAAPAQPEGPTGQVGSSDFTEVAS